MNIIYKNGRYKINENANTNYSNIQLKKIFAVTIHQFLIDLLKQENFILSANKDMYFVYQAILKDNEKQEILNNNKDYSLEIMEDKEVLNNILSKNIDLPEEFTYSYKNLIDESNLLDGFKGLACFVSSFKKYSVKQEPEIEEALEVINSGDKLKIIIVNLLSTLCDLIRIETNEQLKGIKPTLDEYMRYFDSKEDDTYMESILLIDNTLKAVFDNFPQDQMNIYPQLMHHYTEISKLVTFLISEKTKKLLIDNKILKKYK